MRTSAGRRVWDSVSRDRHSRRARPALTKLAETDPALAALALWCGHRDRDGEALVSTDGRTVFYGPAFEDLTLPEQVGLAAHHILHIAFRHVPRAAGLRTRIGDGFDEEVFNIAADALVNQTLHLAGYVLPRPAVLLDGVLVEAGDDPGDPREAIARYDVERLYVRLMRPSEGRGKARRDEDGGDRNRSAEEAGEAARAYARRAGFAPDMRVPDGMEGEDATEAAAEWRQRVARALEAGRLAGRGVGALGTRIADLPETRTPWEVVLRALVTRAVTEGPRLTHTRPARRWLARDSAARAAGQGTPPFEPALRRDSEVPRIAVGIDCSGSVDDARLARFAGQVAGIGQRTGAEVHVLAFDEAVRSQRRMAGADWAREITDLAFAREGGTSFVGVMEAALALDPSVVVVLTDLEGPFGPPPRAVPVIWAVPEEVGGPPPFGRVVTLDR